ncbi:MAG TPA: YqgE/AlgH family protein [Actinomycetota bacterium]|nr:YqgE/AlgH family protein [Actinomycetota bacterium]
MESLRGQLLIAGGGLWDPNFRRTVVLVGEHDDEGAVGVVINRPSPVPVAEAVPPLEAIAGAGEPIFVGGPVQPQAVVVLAEFDDPARAGRLVMGSIGFLPERTDGGTAAGILRARVFAGYAGWGPGQLEHELEEGSWIVEPALPEDLFSAEPEALWSAVLRRKGREFAALALMPLDPSLN